MKALELRKRQMKAKKEKDAKQAKAAEAAAEESVTVTEESAKSDEVADTEASSPELAKEDDQNTVQPDDNEETATHHDQVEDHCPKDDAKQSIPQEDSSMETMSSQTETDDQHSAASACSPTSAQTLGSSCAPSTRPSSISEDEIHDVDHDAKTQHEEEPIDQEAEISSEPSLNEDEKESIESTPTIVPEMVYTVPSAEDAQSNQQSAPLSKSLDSEGAFSRRTKRESMIFMPPLEQGDAQFRSRSNRESAIYLPIPIIEGVQQEDASNRRAKRESMILPASSKQGHVEENGKRRANIDPIQIHISAENSEAEYLSDDSFMEELQSATLEEAKPISVAKSPIAQMFPRTASVSEVTIPERSSSQQSLPMRPSPDRLQGRNVSGGWPPHANTDTVVVAKKINVSTGISQRIKALAEKSNRDSAGPVSPLATPDTSKSIVSQRKSSFFSTPPTGNSPSGNSVKRLSRASFVTLPNATSPDRKSVLQPTPTERAVYNVQQSPKKPESVQVTARIVRDRRTQKPTLTMPNENTPLELHQSPIIIDHQKSAGLILSSKQSPSKVEPTSPRPPSSSHSKDQSAALPRSSSESSWRSFGRRLSESRPAPRSHSTHSVDSAEERREEKKEKKDSRTSKMFKRMSSITSISRKNQGISSMLPEEEHQSTSLPSLCEPPPAVQVGDLNVQFPDTLVGFMLLCLY